EVIDLGTGAVELCDAVAATTSAPVVVLCQHSDEGSVLDAYRAGAASVLSDSTGPRELVARARALVRRGIVVEAVTDDVIVVGPVALDRACRQLTVGGRLVPL